MFRNLIPLIALALPQITLASQESQSQELLKWDREWAALSSKGKNVDKIVSYWTDDAILFLPGEPTISGKRAIRKFVKESFALPGFHISWKPEKAVVSKDGTVGYTFGTNEITVPGPNGKLITTKGRGVTTWTRHHGGQWRCTVDISNSDH